MTSARARCRLAAAALLAALSLLYVVGPTVADPAPPPPMQPRAASAIAPPPLTAQVAFAADLTTGVELYDLNADTPVAPASTAKVVTALLVRQLLPLDAAITVRDSDLVDATIYSAMGLQAGDVVSVRDLLAGLLIPSGGDAANALARAGGLQLGAPDHDAIERFMQELNDYAQSIGMTSSHFSNPMGVDAPDEVTTARDLVRATQRLLADQTLAALVKTPGATVHVEGPNARDLPLTNTNQLLARDDVFGVKTGTEDEAGQCLITGFWRGDNQIITVVLGSQDRYADTQAMMDAIDAQYRWLALGIGATSLGATDDLAARGLTFMTRVTVLMSQEQAQAMTYELQLNDAESASGRRGVAIFRYGDREVMRLSVYSRSALPATP